MAYNNWELGNFFTPINLPEIGVNVANPGVRMLQSQISTVLLLPVGTRLPALWTDYDALQAIIDNTDTTGSRGKLIGGIGEVTDPALINANLGRVDVKRVSSIYTLTHTTPVWCAQYYEMLRTLQKNPLHLHVWFFTVGGSAFGGSQGIRPFYVTCSLPKLKGRDSVETGTITIQWRADGDPARTYMEQLIGGDPDDNNQEFQMYRQEFLNTSTGVLTWTRNAGQIPTSPNTRFWVHMNGQKMLPLSYSVTPNTGVGEATITINPDYYVEGNSFELFSFEF